jgi:hypothetical protein
MVTLTYPYGSPTVTIYLPNPILGDTDQITQSANFGMAMSGRVYSYIMVGMTEKLLLDFTNLNFTEAALLKDFIYRAIGGDSGYLDQDSIQWRGVFINDPFEEVGTRRSYLSSTLEFEGERI